METRSRPELRAVWTDANHMEILGTSGRDVPRMPGVCCVSRLTGLCLVHRWYPYPSVLDRRDSDLCGRASGDRSTTGLATNGIRGHDVRTVDRLLPPSVSH